MSRGTILLLANQYSESKSDSSLSFFQKVLHVPEYTSVFEILIMEFVLYKHLWGNSRIFAYKCIDSLSQFQQNLLFPCQKVNPMSTRKTQGVHFSCLFQIKTALVL